MPALSKPERPAPYPTRKPTGSMPPPSLPKKAADVHCSGAVGFQTILEADSASKRDEAGEMPAMGRQVEGCKADGGKVRGQNIDTQTTEPWVGQGSQDLSELPLATIADMQQLPACELGPVLFDGKARLSGGAEGFKDYFLSEFPDCMMTHDVDPENGNSALPRVLAITRELIQELRDAMDKRTDHEKSSVAKKAALHEATARVCSQADSLPSEKGKRKKALTVAWMTREIAKLDATGRDLCSEVSRLSLLIGKKIHALWKHLQTHNLLSQQFLDRLEAWHELDVVAASSEIIRQAAQMDSMFADTQLEDDGDDSTEKPTQPAVELEEQAIEPAEPAPDGLPGAEQPEQAAVEAAVSLLGPIGNPGAEQAKQTAVEATVSPLGPVGNPRAEQAKQTAVEATVSYPEPIGNPDAEQAKQTAVEATVSPLASIGNPSAEQAKQTAVEATVSPPGPVGNPSAEQAKQTAVEATVSPLAPIGNPSAEQAKQTAVEATVLGLGIGNPSAEQAKQAAHSAPSTPKKQRDSAVRNMATPQRHLQSPSVPVVACDSDAEDDAVADALLNAQFQAWKLRDDGDGTQSVDVKKEEPWLKGEESLDDIIDIIHEVAAQMDDYMPLQEGDHDLDEETLAKIEAERKKEKRAAYMRMSEGVPPQVLEAVAKSKGSRGAMQKLFEIYTDSGEDYEMYLCFDTATISKKTADKQDTSMTAGLELTGEQHRMMMSSIGGRLPVRLGEHSRALTRSDTNNSLESQGSNIKNKNKNKGNEQTKAVNWVAKGKAKIKDARSVATDSRCLRRQIEQNQKNPETSKSEDMVKGYNSELDKYTTEIEKAMDSLEAVLIEGAKEAEPQPKKKSKAKAAPKKIMVDVDDEPVVSYTTASLQCIWVVEDRLMPVILPHELVAALHKTGELTNMYDMQGLREYWDHVIGHATTQVPWPNNVPDMILPAGLHGDDCRFTDTGEKIVVISWNLVLDVWVAPDRTASKDEMNARLALAFEDFNTWAREFWLAEFFNRMECYGHYLSDVEKAMQELCHFATVDGINPKYYHTFRDESYMGTVKGPEMLFAIPKRNYLGAYG
ncbi:S-antigen protein [Symbiodinium microadriaticum]|uniref:S-antigen protein n=1 Tax=Symbiodinium microadriaticum TaxID=2951 RepID=A0A1Q9CLY1_SYMMI|nr:S-antigen protein [Symbiodinium microadriaticum]